MATMEQVYKSPLGKLTKFFEASRNRWKDRHHEVKAELKLAQNQVRAVEKSREMWRTRAEDFDRRIRELEAELAEAKIRSGVAAGGR